MRVDGHTDVRPIAEPQFPSNWELPSARAISVVRYLIAQGHARRSAWSPQASANSSRSTPAQNRRGLSAATAASS